MLFDELDEILLYLDTCNSDIVFLPVVSQHSSSSKRQTLSVTQTLTTGTLATDPAVQKDGNQQKDGIGEKLAKIFPVIRVIQVQVTAV